MISAATPMRSAARRMLFQFRASTTAYFSRSSTVTRDDDCASMEAANVAAARTSPASAPSPSRNAVRTDGAAVSPSAQTPVIAPTAGRWSTQGWLAMKSLTLLRSMGLTPP